MASAAGRSRAEAKKQGTKAWVAQKTAASKRNPQRQANG